MLGRVDTPVGMAGAVKGPFTVWKAGGGGVPTVYGFGWWTGPDQDLLCVRNEIFQADEAERLLSPMRESILLALLAFVGLRIASRWRRRVTV